MIDFLKIDYLKNGNERQKTAYQVLTKHHIFEKLKSFNPILTGTIPINIDIPESDLDIICFYHNKVDFIDKIVENFEREKDFLLKNTIINNIETVIANFWIDEFEIELFGQNIPTRVQNAFRHMIIEHQILTKMGEDFRLKIIELKKGSYKTEPAFARLLNIDGDGYISLLNYRI
ncbi:MAG: DUF4269 domain-containing protein [Flavobacterium sp.]|nr:MAG: DUF4269 domain-containing protein [Flavobacterium sp.]